MKVGNKLFAVTSCTARDDVVHRIASSRPIQNPIDKMESKRIIAEMRNARPIEYVPIDDGSILKLLSRRDGQLDFKSIASFLGWTLLSDRHIASRERHPRVELELDRHLDALVISFVDFPNPGGPSINLGGTHSLRVSYIKWLIPMDEQEVETAAVTISNPSRVIVTLHDQNPLFFAANVPPTGKQKREP